MFRVIARSLLARKFRLVTTALAVTLGVAFMAGTLVLTDTIGQTFNDLSAGVYKGTDASVRATAVFTGPQFTGDQRPFVSAALLRSLSRVRGVAASEGSVFGYTRLIGQDGKALGNPAAGAPTLGGTGTRWPRSTRSISWPGTPPRRLTRW
jgi:putative ABC transport system permease protein